MTRSWRLGTSCSGHRGNLRSVTQHEEASEGHSAYGNAREEVAVRTVPSRQDFDREEYWPRTKSPKTTGDS